MEGGEVAALQAELGKIQEEQARLPALVKEVADALEAEAAAFRRQDAGGRAAGWHGVGRWCAWVMWMGGVVWGRCLLALNLCCCNMVVAPKLAALVGRQHRSC